VLWPGSAGSILIRKAVDAKRKKGVVIGEAATLPYCCRRLEGPGTVNIHRINGPRIQVAALPASDTPKIFEALQGVYETIVPAKSIVEPALYNPNIIVHPTGALLNMGRIEHVGGDFWMYKEGITRSVKMVINAMDAERQAIIRRLGLKPKTYDEIFEDVYYVPFEQFKAASAKGPFSMQDRYITEDVPMGCVFTSSLGRRLGVPTPTYDAIIQIASVVNGSDYSKTGRTLENLGLAKLSPARLRNFLLK
jgi:opine dehydrogenase